MLNDARDTATLWLMLQCALVAGVGVSLFFWPYAAGALTLALGFWHYTVPALVVGGTLVFLGVAVALVVLGRTLRSVPQLNLTGRYIISALVYFLSR